jgi:DNA-binding response OmpR family regulator
MESPKAILVIEDDPLTREMLSDLLQAERFSVETASQGKKGLEKLKARNFDLILIDMHLPDIFGLDLYRQIKSQSMTPCMFLTGNNKEVDIVLGLELGAEDYLLKPFKHGELLARIRKILFRQQAESNSAPKETLMRPFQESLQQGILEFNLESKEFWIAKKQVNLTVREFELLYFLASNPQRVYSRAKIIDLLWPYDGDVIERVIDTHVYKIRTKIAEIAPGFDYILTIRGRGYRFNQFDYEAEPAYLENIKLTHEP